MTPTTPELLTVAIDLQNPASSSGSITNIPRQAFVTPHTIHFDASPTLMRRVVSAHAASMARQGAEQRVMRSTSSMTLLRGFATSRARLADERVSEGTRLSTPEKVMEKLWDHARTRGGVNLATDVFSIIVWTGIAGYAVKRSLLPSRMRPDILMTESTKMLTDNREVTARIGSPLRVSESDERIGFPIDHVNFKSEDGKPHLRIKYDLEGPGGHVEVFAEIAEDSKKGDYVYLILKFVDTGEVVNIIDNRRL